MSFVTIGPLPLCDNRGMSDAQQANAEIIAVGSELLTPTKIDTNSLFLTEHLNALGVEVIRKSIVGDDRARLTAAIREAVANARIVILTGGLGPTEDDVTRDAAAEATGCPLRFEEQIVGWIEERFRRFNRKMAEINKRQAYVLEGAEILENPRGTAPGQWLERGGKVVMLLPGPPGELKPLFTGECLPRLGRLLPPQVIRELHFRVTGMGESDVDSLVAPVYTKYSNPVTTILAGAGDISLHLRARCGTGEEAEALLAEVGPKIEAILGDRIYSKDGDSLEAVAGLLLKARGAMVAVAESCTAGLLGGRITNVAGSSAWFAGGFITYSDAMKTALLGVDPALLAEKGAVSEEVAKAMADGARQRTGADYAVSVTGEAGPEPSDPKNPVGLLFLGIATPQGTEARRVQVPGDRNRIRSFATQTALDLLRRALLV